MVRITEMADSKNGSNDPTMLATGFEQAFIGVGSRPGRPMIMVYDIGKAIDILKTRDGMSQEEADEYLSFNVVGAWLGEGTPLFVERCSLEDAKNFLEEQEGS